MYKFEEIKNFMKQTLIPFPFFLITIIVGHSQQNKPSDFIPEGYTEFSKQFEDLNKDGQDDCIIMIKKVDPSNIVINDFDQEVDRNRRGIIVLFKNGNNYELVLKNYSCFASENEDGGVYFAPELSLEFERGNLIIHYAHGRYGYWRYIFRYQNANFELIGYDEGNGGVIASSEVSINFLTKKKLTRENTYEDSQGGEEIFQEVWENIEIEHLIKLSEIKDIDELDMYKF